MKRILITGGAGFIGSNLALSLIDKGYKITILDTLSTQIHGENPEISSPLYASIKNKVNFIAGSVTDKAIWPKALEEADAIVHFAAETGTGQSMYEIEKYVTTNIGGTSIMLDYLINHKHTVKKVIIASSRAIYGEGKYETEDKKAVYPGTRVTEDMLIGDFEVKMENVKGPLKLVPTDENSKIQPTSVYGITKQNQEQLVMTVCKAIGIPAVSLRYQNVYGPGQSLSNPYTGILSIFSNLIKHGKEINIFEDGNESRDFVYIDDVVAATILSLEKKEADDQIFNVGSGVATSVKDVAEILLKLNNAASTYKITGNFRVGDIRHNFADISKISKLLGFKPTIFAEEGITKFAGWAIGQPIQADNFSKSIKEMEHKGLYK